MKINFDAASDALTVASEPLSTYAKHLSSTGKTFVLCYAQHVFVRGGKKCRIMVNVVEAKD